MIAAAGSIVILISATPLYLASPNLPFRGRTGLPKARAFVGALGMVLGLILILQWAGSATSVFIALTLPMLVWTIVPLATAVWRGARENRK